MANKKTSKPIIKDDAHEITINDIEKIQLKPSQYIGTLGSEACMHLSKEVINNAWDEVINPNAIGKTVIIHLDEKKNELTVMDDSRGIPFEILESMLTIISASTKTYRDCGGTSAGENGTGIKATNALSEEFEATVARDGKKGRITFNQGKIKNKLKIVETGNYDDHGTTIRFKPSELFLGEGAKIEPDQLNEWVNKLIFLLPKDVTTILIIDRIEEKSSFKNTLVNKDGLKAYCNILAKGEIPTISHLINMTTLKELVTIRKDSVRGKLGEQVEMDRNLGIELAFGYNQQSTELITDSFCNMVNTFDNGIHFEAIKAALFQFLIEETSKIINKRDSKELNILPKDCEQGLVITCSVMTDINPEFMAQIKSKVGNKALFEPIRELTYNTIQEYFKNNQRELKDIIEIVKTNAKARLASTKARKSVVKDAKSALSLFSIKNLRLCNNRSGYREIMATEGGSASQGDALYSKDWQSIYKFRGYPLNTYDLEMDKILQNPEMNGFITALECNTGVKFDINKLAYDKIIIMTDSDADGYYISSFLIAFFFKHMRPIIEEGHLYKSIAPLFKLKDGRFITSKKEYIEEYENDIEKNFDIFLKGNKNKMNKNDVLDLLYINRDYFEVLESISKQYSVHRDIIEFVAFNYDKPGLTKKLQERFKEMTVKKNTIYGVYKDKYQLLIVDNIFARQITRLIELGKANNGNLIYTLHDKKKDVTMDNISLGNMMYIFNRFQPAIETRFKGLGELNSEDLRETAMHPENRILYRITIEDAIKAKEMFDILHGENKEPRRELLGFINLNKEYLDN